MSCLKAAAILATVAGLMFALFIHLAQGHSWEIIRLDFAHAAIFFAGSMLSLVSFLALLKTLKTPDHIWEERRQLQLAQIKRKLIYFKHRFLKLVGSA